MDERDDVLEASVSELVRLFREAMTALAPIASRAKLPWDGIDVHPAWERLAASAFEAFVRGPASTDEGRRAEDAPLASYDIDRDSYSGVSWIGVSDEKLGVLALVRFVSRSEPFDSVEFAQVSPFDSGNVGRVVLPWSRLQWRLFRRSADGAIAVLSQVVAEE